MISINHRKIMLYKDMYMCSVVSDYVTPFTGAQQSPQSMGFPRKEYWSGLLFPSLGDLPNPSVGFMSPTLAGGFLSPEPSGKPNSHIFLSLFHNLSFVYEYQMILLINKMVSTQKFL